VDIALKKQNLNAVITNLVEIVRVEPEATTAFDLARLLVQVGKADAAIQYYRIALDMKPDWHQAYNNLALILATHPDAQVRNGAEAVALAERACALTQSQVPVYLSTLAAAYAEAGRFNDAVRTAEQASALAEALGQTNLARRNAELLQLYRAGKPFHDQSLSPGAAVP
jgi:Flp pilus assembly protein TadD